MIGIRAIQEKDYPEVARIWRDVLDIPVTDECLAIGHRRGYTKADGLSALSEYRGKGIGRMPLEKAEEIAKENGTRYPGLASGDETRRGKNFQTAFGKCWERAYRNEHRYKGWICRIRFRIFRSKTPIAS